jgi:hypothetical protein
MHLQLPQDSPPPGRETISLEHSYARMLVNNGASSNSALSKNNEK